MSDVTDKKGEKMKNKKCREAGQVKFRKVNYAVIKERLYCVERSRILRAYGIVITVKGRAVEKVSDISASRHAVSMLVRKCNKYSLDPIHLTEVVEDFLSE